MKLSVLIPIYNRSVYSLLNELSFQSEQYGTSVEIICLDDGSDLYSAENKETAERLQIPYHISKNRGRAISRNELVNLAEGEYLLFLDCDSGIVRTDFLSSYIELMIKQNSTVIYGGRIYPEKPDGKGFALHWKYGKHIEAAPLNKRLKNPHLTFMSNNFMVKKEIFQANPMDEALDKYGYEDLLWALELKKKNIPISHINNPVLHEDLCSFDVFLSKSKQALANLAFLTTTKKLHHQSTPLLKTHKKLELLKLLKLFRFFFRLSQPLLEFQLKSNYPLLVLFNIWKLGLYSKMKAQKNIN